MRIIDLKRLVGAEITGSTLAPPDKLPKRGENVPKGDMDLMSNYQKLGRDISRCLVDSLSEPHKASVQRLYTLETCFERGVAVHYPELTSSFAYDVIAGKAKLSGRRMNVEVAGWLVAVIQGRRRLRNWHGHLPKNDGRFPDNEQHERFLQTLIKVAKELLGPPYNFQL